MAGPSIGSTALHLSADASEFQKGLTHAERLFQTYAAHMKRDAAGLQKQVKASLSFGDLVGVGAGAAGGMLGGLGIMGAAGGIASGLAGLVVESVKLAANVEDTKTDFRVLLGDAG